MTACTTTQPPNPAPSPMASPILPAPVTEYPAKGWHSDYDKWLKEGFLANSGICPRATLTPSIWVDYWKQIVNAESSFNLTSQYTENLGIDSVTKAQVKSEGLFQLSYQDQQGYPECSVFNWSLDKVKETKDLTKTIFNPYNQFKCAMAIAKKLTARYPTGHPKWVSPYGAYWSTARQTGRGYINFKKQHGECF